MQFGVLQMELFHQILPVTQFKSKNISWSPDGNLTTKWQQKSGNKEVVIAAYIKARHKVSSLLTSQWISS